ncbi:MAG: ABC transporter ATP-binding protein [Acidimicrobiales bacterium]
MIALRCVDLHATLGKTQILHGIDLSVEAGSWTAIVGPNGAGKTTLLRAILGLVHSKGELHVSGEGLTEMTLRERALRLAYVPQQPTIPPGVGVFDYVLLGRVAHQKYGLAPGSEDVLVVERILKNLDLTSMSQRRVDSLSGGERQRAVVARALTQQSPMLLLDEPTTSLDIGHQYEVLELVDTLRRTQSLTVLSTMHDLGLAGQFADRLVLLAGGRVVADGSPDDVLTEDLLKSVYGISVRVLRSGDGLSVVPHRHSGPGS